MADDYDALPKWRVGFYVEVEVDAYEGEAVMMAETACNWPGSLSPPRDPVEVEGTTWNRKPVTARILRSRALMVKPIEGRGTDG